MDYTIPKTDFPFAVDVSEQVLPEERDRIKISKNRSTVTINRDAAFHDKKEKNMKTNKGGSYRVKIANKYKKSQTRGDIFGNRRSKNKRK